MEKINRITGFFRKTVIGLICSVLLQSAFLSDASAASISLISDEETEQFLARQLRPVFKAADIPFNRNNIYIVNDDSLNAFVGDGNNMFVHTGTLMKANDENEVAGVLAHETGHIMGGHILRQKIKLQNMQQISLASMLAAGAAAAATGRADAAIAIMMGTQSSMLNAMLAYQVEEERSADESAVKLLQKTEQSPAGMRNFMKKIDRQNRLNGIAENPYFRTHPVTAERISFLNNAARQSPFPAPTHPSNEFLRIKAKLSAFMEEPRKVLQKYPPSDKSTPARYAQAIVFFRMLKLNQSLKILNELIAEEPENPYFHELKGQIFMETGKIKPARTEYQKALSLLPNSALFQINLAQAVLEDNPNRNELEHTAEILNKSLLQRPDTYGWLLLSRAYGGLNDAANSNYAAAEYSLRIGAAETARRQANTALTANPSPQLRLKIDDLLNRIGEEDKK
ncbi:MAG TPA: M48 family metalloprotease [Candidatus Scatocola faecigallinarum]|nr:M48 family metalloprotease [Candidatus Scatocola faecigallinarum]